jgi:hypothetical protein
VDPKTRTQEEKRDKAYRTPDQISETMAFQGEEVAEKLHRLGYWQKLWKLLVYHR